MLYISIPVAISKERTTRWYSNFTWSGSRIDLFFFARCSGLKIPALAIENEIVFEQLMPRFLVPLSFHNYSFVNVLAFNFACWTSKFDLYLKAYNEAP